MLSSIVNRSMTRNDWSGAIITAKSAATGFWKLNELR